MLLSREIKKISQIFPMHLSLSLDLEVVSAGLIMQSIVREGAHVSEYLAIDKGRHRCEDWLALTRRWHDGAVVFAGSKEIVSVNLRGEVACLDSGYFLNFGFRSSLPKAVDALGLAANNFSSWDSSIDYMLLFEGSKISTRHLVDTRDGLSDAHEATRGDSFRDPLTGVMNRRGLLNAVTRIKKLPGSYLCRLYVFDINSFKKINDSYGHSEGDRVLVALAAELSILRGKYDVVARIGGDEFAFLHVKSCKDENDDITGGMEVLVNERLSCRPGFLISVSSGFSPDFSAFDFNLEKAVGEADVMLYKRKYGL